MKSERITTIAILVKILLLSSCSGNNDRDLLDALDLAGDNRIELEKVIEHYSEVPEKLEAAKFLIANMPGHYSYEDTALINQYYDEVDAAIDAMPGANRNQIADTVNSIARKLRINDIKKVQDITIITSSYLIRNIDEAFDEWHNGKWARQLTFEQFCEYLLPYKVAELQPFDSWRRDFHDFHIDSLYELDYCDMFRTSAYSAAVVMNKNLGELVKPFIWDAIEHPIYRLSTRSRIPFGPCDDYAYMTTAFFRSVGIPTTIEVNPHWAYRSLGHRGNAILAPTGKNLLFTGLSTGPEKTHHVDEKKAKMFRLTYARNPDIYELQKSGEYVPTAFKNMFLKDVTDEYVATSDISIKTNKENDGYAFLAVYGDQSWFAVDFAKLKNNNIKFAKVGQNIMYLLVRYDSTGKMRSLTDPFILDSYGKINYIKPNLNEIQSTKLFRKFPVIEYVHKYARLINGGEFEASNSPDFSDAVLVHRINDGKAIGHEVSLSDSLPRFRYWRYIQRHRNAHCNMGEVYFYDGEGHKLTGTVIGTDGHRTIYEGMTRENLFDGNLLTSFNSPNANGDWAGLDFGKPVNVAKIIYYGRGDGNTVEIGDLYELYFWNEGTWRSLGQKVADGISLTYDNVPSGALLLLRDLTKGKDERIFMIDENGRQEWW